MCLQYLIFVQNHSIFPGNSLHNFSIFYMPKNVLRIYNNPANFGHHRSLILYMYNLHIFCPQKGDFRPVEAVFCISGLKKIVYVQTDRGSLDFHLLHLFCRNGMDWHAESAGIGALSQIRSLLCQRAHPHRLQVIQALHIRLHRK